VPGGRFAPFGHLREQQHRQRDRQNDAEDQQSDLQPTVRPVAQDLAGAAVDEDAIRLLLVAVVRQPHRQQDVLERDADVPRLHALEPLVVAADVLLAQPADRLVHDGARLLEAVARADLVALRLEAAEEFGLEVLQPLQFLRHHHVAIPLRQSLRGADQHVVEEVTHLAGHRRPARLAHLARLRLGLPLGVGLGVRLGLPVVVAALAGVVGVGHRVERPEGDVEAVEPPEVGQFAEGVGREPQAGDPVRESIDRRALVHLERQHALRLDHRLGHARLVLQVGAAVRTPVGDDLVFEEDDGGAGGARDLVGVALHGRFQTVAVAEVGFKVVFLEVLVAVLDGHRVAAVGAGQGTGRRVEVELGAALGTGELAAGRRRLGDGGFLDFTLGGGHGILACWVIGKRHRR